MSERPNLNAIEARLAAVPDTGLRVLSNDPFNSELTICKVMPLASDGPIKSAIVGEVAYMTETEETLNYATLFVFARPDMVALVAWVKRLESERATYERPYLNASERLGNGQSALDGKYDEVAE